MVEVIEECDYRDFQNNFLLRKSCVFMRVRKMNQVDVKLHDLTKVKLKNYRLNWEETGNPVPRIRNWMERLDYQAVQRRELAKLPERTILFLEENQDTLFSDVILLKVTLTPAGWYRERPALLQEMKVTAFISRKMTGW